METISTKQAPQAIGPYSQGIREGKLIFVSGQIPLEPESGAENDTLLCLKSRNNEKRSWSK